jgi:cell division protein FtsW
MTELETAPAQVAPKRKFTFKKILQGDSVIWTVFFLLCLISVVEVYSAASTLSFKSGNYVGPLIKQASFLAVGVVICIIVHKIPCRIFKLLPIIGWPFCIFLLVLTFFIGGDVNNSSRWIPLGAFSFQPSELAKGVVIAAVALILGNSQREEGAHPKAFKQILCVTLPVCGLIFTENLSTAAILFAVVFAMMIIGRVEWKQLGKLAAWGVAIVALVITLAQVVPKETKVYDMLFHRFDTWTERIMNVFSSDDGEAQNDFAPGSKEEAAKFISENPQVGRAYVAVASSNVVGRMPGNSIERDNLYQAYSDYIYAIIIEELGIVGGALVVLLYIILIFRAGRLASRCERNFPAFLCMGLSILLVFQACINMMVAVGLFPVTGQTLPLISRGGTATIINCVYFGMILSVSRYARRNRVEDAAKMEIANIKV